MTGASPPAGRAGGRGRPERPRAHGDRQRHARLVLDPGRDPTVDARVAWAVEQAAAGAAIVDVGSQSSITGVAELPVVEEIARVVPVVAGIVAAAPGLVVSVDTYRPEVVAAVLDAGAAIVNDVSGLRHPEVGRLCAQAGAGLVVMHARAVPKVKVLDDAATTRPGRGRRRRGVRGRPPGGRRGGGGRPRGDHRRPRPDFAKTPHQTVAVLAALGRVAALGRPILLALSRKDFVGAITGRPPALRLAGTLAAVGRLAGRARSCGCTTWPRWPTTWRWTRPWPAPARSTWGCASARTCATRAPDRRRYERIWLTSLTRAKARNAHTTTTSAV